MLTGSLILTYMDFNTQLFPLKLNFIWTWVFFFGFIRNCFSINWFEWIENKCCVSLNLFDEKYGCITLLTEIFLFFFWNYMLILKLKVYITLILVTWTCWIYFYSCYFKLMLYITLSLITWYVIIMSWKYSNNYDFSLLRYYYY